MNHVSNINEICLGGSAQSYVFIRFAYVFFLVGLFVSVIFDPSNQIFGLKTILFYCFSVVSLFILVSRRIENSYYLLVFLMGVLMPAAFFAVGFLRGMNWDSDWAFSTVKSHFFLFSVVFFALNAVLVLRVFMFFCFSLSIAIVLMFLGVSANFAPAVDLSKWLTFGVETAKIGYRAYGDISLPMIYYKTSVLLIIGVGLLGLVKDKNRFLLMCFFSAALFLSGTRANIIASCFLILVYVMHYWVKSVQSKAVLMIVLVPLGAYALFVVMSNFLSPDEQSNIVKSIHLQSYIDTFREDPWVFLVGQGFGSGFYSIYHAGVVYETELTLLELLRRGGVGVLLLFCVMFLYPIVKARHYLFKASFLMYFLVSSTNPLLISSTGMLALAIGYTYLLVEKISESEIGGGHV